MSILLNKNTKVLIQGMTGRIGSFHAQEMVDYGTNFCLLYTSDAADE